MAEESDLEEKCLDLVKHMGGRMPKWTSPGTRGVPDRILLLPNKPPVFIEFKAPGGKLSPAQVRWASWLDSNNFKIWLVFDYENFERLLTERLLGDDK